MDFVPNEETITHFLLMYGSISLFAVLALGIIILPVPEETLMVVAGLLIYQGKLTTFPTLLAAYAGSLTGITGSYIIGRTVGHRLLAKYGGWIGFTPDKIQKVHDWFERYGKWSLMVGYFIPGVRHFTGICAGTTYLSYHHFALFAYTGAILWVSFFLSIGYFLGDYWLVIYDYIEGALEEITLAIIVAVLAFLVWKFARKKNHGTNV